MKTFFIHSRKILLIEHILKKVVFDQFKNIWIPGFGVK